MYDIVYVELNVCMYVTNNHTSWFSDQGLCWKHVYW